MSNQNIGTLVEIGKPSHATLRSISSPFLTIEKISAPKFALDINNHIVVHDLADLAKIATVSDPLNHYPGLEVGDLLPEATEYEYQLDQKPNPDATPSICRHRTLRGREETPFRIIEVTNHGDSLEIAYTDTRLPHPARRRTAVSLMIPAPGYLNISFVTHGTKVDRHLQYFTSPDIKPRLTLTTT